MKKGLLIFGTGKIAEVVAYYAVHECGLSVVAFIVDDAFKTSDQFLGRPVVASSRAIAQFPADQYDMFVAVGYHNLNKLREMKLNEMMALGYNIISIVPPHANVPTNVTYGKNCFIMPPAVIHPCVTLGDNVFVWSGAMIGHHTKVGANVWLTSSCNIGGNVTIGKNTFLAVNATIGHSVEVGAECFLGANVLVTKKLDDQSVVIEESTKPFRLNSAQFLRMSSFSNL